MEEEGRSKEDLQVKQQSWQYQPRPKWFNSHLFHRFWEGLVTVNVFLELNW